MYIKETKWYRNQEKKKKRLMWMKWFMLCLVMVLCICFGVYLGSTLSFAQDFKDDGLNIFNEDHRIITEYEEQASAEVRLYGMRQLVFLWKHLQVIEMDENMSVSLGAESTKAVAGEQVQESLVYDMEQNDSQPTDVSVAVQVPQRIRIAIDAGHGGEDEGCSFEDVEEKMINLRLAELLKEKLMDADYEVVMIRQDDVQIALQERVNMANQSKVDAFISIHQNSCEEEMVQGIEVWYGSGREESERLAKLVERYMVAETGAKGRGVISTDTLFVIRETDMPSVLVETGYLSNKKENHLLQDEAYLEKLAEGMTDAIQYYFSPKEMYLTFDDGPSGKNTELILDILKEKGIKATFFVIGENVEKYPEITRRIVAEGHTIGIHCYRHDYDDIYANVDSYLADFEKAKQVLFEATGVEAKLFRFPGGSINAYNEEVYEDIIKEMTSQGYIYFDWNASLEDAVRHPDAQQLIQNAKESTLGRKKIIMLAHDTVDETAVCLEELIGEFPEYEMKALDANVFPIQF